MLWFGIPLAVGIVIVVASVWDCYDYDDAPVYQGYALVAEKYEVESTDEDGYTQVNRHLVLQIWLPREAQLEVEDRQARQWIAYDWSTGRKEYELCQVEGVCELRFKVGLRSHQVGKLNLLGRATRRDLVEFARRNTLSPEAPLPSVDGGPG
ncbi:MAG: hypothetical protein JXR96_07175 [Deltaproteobacteria bacterium]|nr:hypothetical protein [Deltaproteobacteria bacterium]